jgi:hypothetical protein
MLGFDCGLGGANGLHSITKTCLLRGPYLLIDFWRWATFDRLCKSILRDGHFATASINKVTASKNSQVFYDCLRY